MSQSEAGGGAIGAITSSKAWGGKVATYKVITALAVNYTARSCDELRRAPNERTLEKSDKWK